MDFWPPSSPTRLPENQKKLATALRRANFRNQKTLEELTLPSTQHQPRPHHHLPPARFIEEKVCVLVVGPCGTGKGHIAQALGHAAVRAWL